LVVATKNEVSSASFAAGFSASPSLSNTLDQETLNATKKDLYDRKDELAAELKFYEAALKAAKEPPTTPVTNSAIPVANPISTVLSISIKPNKTNQAQLLTVTTDNDCVIKMLCVICEGMFENGESKVLIPAREKESSSLSMTLRWTKNLPFALDIKAIVGHRNATNDAVIEAKEALPRFANFFYCKPRDMQMPAPKASVTFHTQERINRLVLWLNASFLLDTNPAVTGAVGAAPSPLILSVNSDSLTVSFIHLVAMTPLIIKFTPEHGGSVVIKSDSMDLCGDLIQDFCRYCKIAELSSTADFPDDFRQAEEAMDFITEFNSSRIKMSAEMAEATQNIKVNLIKSEDARMLELPDLIQKNYQACANGNNEMLGEFAKRENNQAELFKYLKLMNTLIQRSASLRVGTAKTRLIAAARTAIKDNSSKAFVKILKVGA